MSPSRLPPVNPICWEGLEFRENSWSGSGGEHRSIKFHGNACVVVGACEGPKTPKISKESTHKYIYIYVCVCIHPVYILAYIDIVWIWPVSVFLEQSELLIFVLFNFELSWVTDPPRNPFLVMVNWVHNSVFWGGHGGSACDPFKHHLPSFNQTCKRGNWKSTTSRWCS